MSWWVCLDEFERWDMNWVEKGVNMKVFNVEVVLVSKMMCDDFWVVLGPSWGDLVHIIVGIGVA